MHAPRSHWWIILHTALFLLCFPGWGLAQQAVSYEQLLNQVKTGVDDATLIRQLEESPIVYVFDREQIAELRKAGASEAVIAAFQKDRVRTKDVITDFILIFDCSNSMNEPAQNGQSKMQVAKTTVADLIDLIPIGMPTSLIVYGHNVEEKCEAVKIGRPLTPLSGADKAELRRFVLNLQPAGWTPIAKSLRVASGVLDSKMDAYTGIVLISDGKETCGGDPAAEARNLAAKHNIEFHVVGFDVDDETRRQLENMAQSGGGKYQGARSPEDLKGALKSVTDQINEAQQRLKDLAKQKEAELAAQRARAAELDKQLALREQQLDDRIKEIAALNKAADDAAAALENAKRQQSDLQAKHDQAMADAKKDNADLSQKAAKTAKQLADAIEKTKGLEAANAKLAEKHRGAEAERDRLAAALDAEQKKAQSLAGELGKANKDLAALQRAADRAAREAADQLAAADRMEKSLKDQLARAADNAKNQAKRLGAMRDAAKDRADALAEELAAMGERLDGELSDAQGRINELASTKQAIENQLADLLAQQEREKNKPYDLASADRGGRIVDAPSQLDDRQHAVSNLLRDGGICRIAGRHPVSVVLAFENEQMAEISQIRINPAGGPDSKNWLRSVRIEYSNTYSFTDFEPLMTVDLTPQDQLTSFDLKPEIEARYLRVTLIDNFGGDAMECGRVQVIGRPAQTQREYPAELTNFASSQNGGTVTAKPSAHDEYHWGALHLIDGSPGRSWSSPIGTTTETATIRLAAETKVQFITVNPYSPSDKLNWATRAVVSVAGPSGSFYEVGSLPLTEVGQEHVLRLNEPVDAALVRVELTSSDDASAVECNEVKVYGPTSVQQEVRIDEVSLNTPAGN